MFMDKNTRENIQVASAIGMLIVIGFFTPPVGQIHESVLGIFAECLIYAGSIFGVAIYIQTKYAELRAYVEERTRS